MGPADRTTSEEAQPEILVHDDGRVRVVTLNRPHRVNAFTAASYRRLAEVLDEADAAPEVSVVLMLGAGRGFSSGVDLDSVGVEGQDLAVTFDELLGSLIRFTKPLLAAVHGAAVGFGTTMLLHCDLVLVAENARLRLPFTALGTAPEAASSFLLPRLVGMQRAADMLLTARWLTGREAAEIGLAARCCPDDSLHAEASATAQALTELPPAALIAAKRLIRAGAADLTYEALDRERVEAGWLRNAVGPMGYRT